MGFCQDFKLFYQSNILLFIILLFVILYVIINWTKVYEGNCFCGEYIKPILITGIIFLIFHMLITWDDNTTNMDEEIIDIPKYKFQNNFDNSKIKNNVIDVIVPNNSIVHNNTIPNLTNEVAPQSLNSKNKFVKNYNIISNNQHPNPINFTNNYSNDDSKLSNRNIFISHKNSSKYGLKF